MKKIFMVFAFFCALIFVVSCGGSDSKSVNQNHEPYNNETVTDEDSADSEAADTSDSDEVPDGDADSAGSHPDEDTDSSDSASYTNTEETGSSLPECSKSSGTPCYDSVSHLTWSEISSTSMNYTVATTFCQGSEMNGYGDFTDWRLPNIDELKTLLTSATGGTPRSVNCQVSERNNCLSFGSCWTCSTCTEQGTQQSGRTDCSIWGSSYDDGRFSKLGDATWLWSSSLLSGNSNLVWRVYFDRGCVSYGLYLDNNYYVRCVR